MGEQAAFDSTEEGWCEFNKISRSYPHFFLYQTIEKIKVKKVSPLRSIWVNIVWQILYLRYILCHFEIRGKKQLYL